MRTLLPLFAILLYLVPEADALSSDLNRDGVVDFDDFFLFADEFGLTGEPDADTVVVVLRDTVFIDPADTVTRSGTPITFADPTVEFVLRDLVGVAEGDLLTGDVDGITALNLSGLNISLLDGLQHFTSLTTLSLTDNLIVDLSPLQGLANLKTVTLAANEVRDIEPLVDNPALANGSSVILVGNPLSTLSRTTYVTTMQDRGATVTADAFAVTFADSLLEVAVRAALMQPTGDLLHLDLETVTTLDVAADSIADLSGIEFMRSLVELDLRDNQITSISKLSSLQKLQVLDLSGNEITSISKLSSLQKLQVLDLSGNAIGSFSPLTGLTAMRELHLSETGMTSVSPLSNLTSLEILFLNLNSHDSISGLVDHTAMQQLNLRDNNIADLSVLLGMGALTDVWLEGNPLDSNASDTVIPTLIDRGAFVRF